MADRASPPSPYACDTDTEPLHTFTDDKGENQSQISACWHRSVRAEWQDRDGQLCSLLDLALSLCYCPATNTAFFKLQAKVDLKGCKHNHLYLHIPPERIRHLALVSPALIQLKESELQPIMGPNTRCLRFEMAQPAVLVAPCWPCHARNPKSERSQHLIQLLGQAAIFTLVVSIPFRTVSDVSFRALSDALACQSLKSDPDQANIRRYYRGQGATAIDLINPATADVPGGKQQFCAGDSSKLPPVADRPPSYNQAVAKPSSPDPLLCSPPKKKRRRDSPTAEQDDPLAQSIELIREDLKRLATENSRLVQAREADAIVLRSMLERVEKEVVGLKEENRRLRQVISEVADLPTLVTALDSKVESLEQRFVTEGEELDHRFNGLEDGLASLDAWIEYHDCDSDQIKDVVREVLEEDSEDLNNRLIAKLIERLQGSS